MRAHVTNRARSPRGFETRDRGIVLLEPDASADLDLAEHPLHRAWEAAGEVAIVPHGKGAEAAERAPGVRRPLSRPREKGLPRT